MRKRRTAREAARFMLETVDEQIASVQGTSAAMESMLRSCDDAAAAEYLRLQVTSKLRRKLGVLQLRRDRIVQLVSRCDEYAHIDDEIRRLVARRAELLNPLEQSMYALARRGDTCLSWG